ncbi:TPA: hypothetical protein JDK12_004916 [Salmonella enterica subsp. diarizonae]|nr:hypothetical protein [Salmonella enterica]EFT7152377.1 hypothetical protein [Salmonella enterica]HAU3321050.1 hypothetical protein [Salmonella enterica subsp. diarizonae]
MFFLPFFLLINGCESRTQKKTLQGGPYIKPASVSGDKLSDVEKMERCRRELDALKKIDIPLYNKRKVEFDRLISGASLYNGVRGDISNNTQSAVDALYRFRADKLCADISSDLLNQLSK